MPDNVRPSGTTWAAYAACAWAFLFAAVSFYWAAGGLAGMETLGEGMRELALARDPQMIAVTWITGVLKGLAGLLALALVQRWGRVVPRWLLRLGAWSAALLFLAYGGINVVQHVMMLIDPSRIGVLLGSEVAVRWHLALWDPVWLIGGILFAAAAYIFGREV